MSAAISATGLAFTWPDGSVVLNQLDLAVGPGRTGIIGATGSGKSTLLRLVAGELQPARGSVTVTGRLGYLPQNLPLEVSRKVDDVLGIAAIRAAISAIEAGRADDEHFKAAADAWDIEERTEAVLGRLGLGDIGLDRRVGSLSGGESMLVGLAAQLLSEPDVLMLDVPTNNLDLAARRRLYDVVAAWTGVMVIVSHDRALLGLVDQVAELSHGQVRWYGGNLAAYEQVVARAAEAAGRAIRTAEADVRRQRRELAQARVKLDRRLRTGRKAQAEKRVPRVVAHARKREAQVSAASSAACTKTAWPTRRHGSVSGRMRCGTKPRSESTCLIHRSPRAARSLLARRSPRSRSASVLTCSCAGLSGSDCSARVARARPRCSGSSRVISHLRAGR